MPAKKKTSAKIRAKAKETTTSKTKTTRRAVPRTASRATAKVSPLKGMPIADWVKAKVSGWQARVVTRLLALARRAAPDATVTIKWGQPVFELNGPFAFIKPAKAHVTFGFWRGTELKDPGGVLGGAGDRMKHLKIASPDALDEASLALLVREAAELNRQKGDPTKR
jgi:hypothetical protein